MLAPSRLQNDPEPSPVCWRLLAGPDPSAGPESLLQHLTRLGRRPSGGTWLLDVLDGSKLKGRGGAGFPAGRKWKSVASAARNGAVVVINLAEGEPASLKDRTLASLRPHLILDGAALAVETVGASRAVVYIGRAHAAARSALTHAIRERRHLRHDPRAVEIVDAPDRYIAGETSALVHLLNGGPAKPTAVPPRPHESGVLGLPTLIQNAETTAHIAMIARFGPEWFRQRGTDGSPGTALVTVSGAVALPGVIEVDRAATIGEVIGAAGGLVTEAQAVLLGGYFGTWVPAIKAWGLQLDDEDLAQHGAAPGCGVILVLPASSCAIAETARILRYLADESAGQCGPCIYGLRSIASAMERVATFRPDPHDLERLRRWAGQIAHRGACHHPDGAVRLLLSTLEVFGYDLWRHTSHQPCRGAWAPSILPVAPMEAGWR